mmetsp:Transcript_86189/g.162485  ORF Transcript_86189/g.162485 Transcript_86189/m.162485 type:complete len:343 (-) Transcript_86189:1467-2495(-)
MVHFHQVFINEMLNLHEIFDFIVRLACLQSRDLAKNISKTRRSRRREQSLVKNDILLASCCLDEAPQALAIALIHECIGEGAQTFVGPQACMLVCVNGLLYTKQKNSRHHPTNICNTKHVVRCAWCHCKFGAADVVEDKSGPNKAMGVLYQVLGKLILLQLPADNLTKYLSNALLVNWEHPHHIEMAQQSRGDSRMRILWGEHCSSHDAIYHSSKNMRLLFQIIPASKAAELPEQLKRLLSLRFPYQRQTQIVNKNYACRASRRTEGITLALLQKSINYILDIIGTGLCRESDLDALEMRLVQGMKRFMHEHRLTRSSWTAEEEGHMRPAAHVCQVSEASCI